MQIPHIPVLLEEVKELFKNLNEGYFLDCTLGFGGHSKALLEKHSRLNLIACDQDEFALNFSKNLLLPFKDRISLLHCNFSEILDKIDTKNLKGILADIGLSSYQLDENKRGFSMHSDFLDMRMDQSSKISAFDVVNSYPKEKLEFIFKEYAELNDASFLAKKICDYRLKEPIKSAKKLCEIIGKARQNNRKISKATLVFQALRIEVNDELKMLEKFLLKLENLKPSGCIVAIVSFHSLEDRMVKNFFKKWAKTCICDNQALRCECGNNNNLGQILTKKAIFASENEISQNSRSSCAKMRAFCFK